MRAPLFPVSHKNFHEGNFSVQTQIYLRKMSPAIMTEGASRKKNQELVGIVSFVRHLRELLKGQNKESCSFMKGSNTAPSPGAEGIRRMAPCFHSDAAKDRNCCTDSVLHFFKGRMCS